MTVEEATYLATHLLYKSAARFKDYPHLMPRSAYGCWPVNIRPEYRMALVTLIRAASEVKNG